MPGVRAWGDEFNPVFQKDAIEARDQENKNGLFEKKGIVNILAISCGGGDGAFGAGLYDSSPNREASKPSPLPRSARSSALPSRVRLHFSIGLHYQSGFNHHMTVNACTLRLLPEERQV